MAASDADDRLAVLVPLAQEGDQRALKEIIQIVHPIVLRYARARISGGRPPTAEDVAQEICLAVATSVGKFQDEGKPFMAFVYGIAFNKVTDAHRVLSRDKSSPIDEIPDQEYLGDTPEDAAMVVAGSNRVRELLDLLSERAKEIVVLRVFVGLSAEQTAEIVGSTAGAVRVAQHRALATMRKAIENEREGLSEDWG
ncbi:sigma-70 family RNA polymerase sigma factor [Corynebacterium urinipleomorphum]|uniref:sigma-70 family RNA polymerase sigma factor n=1 Tax=Corynebacterium urinipleomorphum TaxID=1852380 RepID=UPI000B35F783|nr:sigma-70 family RNA polymerase sigma factor [Corynebacterium urinipleomorphum]